jgi:hypothetical protein
MSPIRTGFALAITVGLFYSLCTVAWTLSPAGFLKFMNALFHGISFDGLVGTAGFDGGGFALALVVMMTWAFLVGTFFAWFARRLAA